MLFKQSITRKRKAGELQEQPAFTCKQIGSPERLHERLQCKHERLQGCLQRNQSCHQASTSADVGIGEGGSLNNTRGQRSYTGAGQGCEARPGHFISWAIKAAACQCPGISRRSLRPGLVHQAGTAPGTGVGWL